MTKSPPTLPDLFRPGFQVDVSPLFHLHLTEIALVHLPAQITHNPEQNRLTPGESFSTAVAQSVPVVPAEFCHNVCDFQSEWVPRALAGHRHKLCQVRCESIPFTASGNALIDDALKLLISES